MKLKLVLVLSIFIGTSGMNSSADAMLDLSGLRTAPNQTVPTFMSDEELIEQEVEQTPAFNAEDPVQPPAQNPTPNRSIREMVYENLLEIKRKEKQEEMERQAELELRIYEGKLMIAHMVGQLDRILKDGEKAAALMRHVTKLENWLNAGGITGFWWDILLEIDRFFSFFGSGNRIDMKERVIFYVNYLNIHFKEYSGYYLLDRYKTSGYNMFVLEQNKRMLENDIRKMNRLNTILKTEHDISKVFRYIHQ